MIRGPSASQSQFARPPPNVRPALARSRAFRIFDSAVLRPEDGNRRDGPSATRPSDGPVLGRRSQSVRPSVRRSRLSVKVRRGSVTHTLAAATAAIAVLAVYFRFSGTSDGGVFSVGRRARREIHRGIIVQTFVDRGHDGRSAGVVDSAYRQPRAKPVLPL